MKPYTLEWWLEKLDQYYYELERYQADRETRHSLGKLIDIKNWIRMRIIKKYSNENNTQ